MSGIAGTCDSDKSEEGKHLKELRDLLQNLCRNEAAMEILRTQLSKVSQRKIQQKKRSDKCTNCGVKVELETLKQFITCKGCEELACHNGKCSDFICGLDVWECAKCKKNRVIQQKAGEWLLKQLNTMKGSDGPINLTKESIFKSEDDESLTFNVSRQQRDRVRQFIEELLAKILDGKLDDVSVGQLSYDEKYVQLFDKHHQKLSKLLLKLENSIHHSLVFGLPIHGPIPSTMTHAELRKFIQTICEEVMNIPHALDFSGVPGRLEEPMPCFDPKKYEQLLATAVINKISDFYQNEKNLPFDLGSETYAAVELDGNHNQVNGNAVDMMAERHQIKQLSSPTMERLNSKAVDDESHLCDYVQNHYVPLPDLSTDSANEDVDVQSIGGSSNGTDATWEDNWLFRTRKLKTENQSIAMLVPSPTEEIKALIGDTNADETSDLSENSDDDEVYDYEIGHSLKTTTLYTNTVLIKTESHPEHMKKGHDEVSIKKATSPDSLTSMQSLTSMDTGSPLITEAKNNLLLMHDDDFAMSLPVSQNGTLLFEMSENRAEFPIEETILNVSNFNIGGSVSEKISALTVLIDKAMDDEEFDSIVSPSQLRDHKKSIDEQFEKLLMDDNNNAEILLPDVVQQPFSEVFIEQVEIIKEEDEKLVDEPTPTQAAQVPSQPDLVPEKRTSIDDPETVLMDAIVPGSFAEREHLKWLHAAPIARNPYSAEVLQRRLSDRENDHKSKVLSLSNHQLVDILVEESAQGHDSSKDNEDDEDVVKPKKVDMKKYKRDYYINDPTEVTKRYSPSFVTTPATTHTSKSNSLDLDDDLSTDKIVPITSGEKNLRARPLHTIEVYSGGSGLSDHSAEILLATPKTVRSNDESLTCSEDSDTTRIYNLTSRETQLVLQSEEISPNNLIESPVKVQSLFRTSPKREIRKMDDDMTTVIPTSNRNLLNGGSENVVQDTYEDKQVIEPEVAEALPSVKKLVEIYAKEPSPEVALMKPKKIVLRKTFIATVNADIPHDDGISPSPDSFMPIYSTTYHPAVGHSITARSIPSQVRADLKKSYSYDEESIIRHDQREGSPEIAPGAARNSIQFFENLQRK